MSNEEKNTARETSVFVAVVGKPNVGKSTLVNRLTGAKIAIVSPKPQTTRSRVTGVITRGECQFVFIDTPGFHTPQTRLGEHMVRSVHDAEDEVDAALFVTWPKDAFDDREKELLADLKSRGVPVLLIVNKCDTAKSKTKLAQQLETLKKDFAFDAAAAVSAATGEGCEKLFSLMKKYAGEGPHFYDDDDMTSQTVREMCSEVLREKLLENLRDELPHGCAVEIDAFSQRDNGITDVDAVVYCEKESHKGMIIGKGGAMLKKIASAARLDMEELIGGKVNLQCRVKTREGWRDDDRFIKYLGY